MKGIRILTRDAEGTLCLKEATFSGAKTEAPEKEEKNGKKPQEIVGDPQKDQSECVRGPGIGI